MDARGRHPAVSQEEGFTLIEVMISAALLGIVLVAILALIDTSARIAPQDMERGHAIQESEAGLYQMTRELRQAHTVVSGDADTMTVRLLPRGSATEITVTWECGAPHPTDSGMRRCTRTQAGGSTQLVIDRVVNVTGNRPVFEYYDGSAVVAPAAAKFVRASVIVPSRGDRSVANGHRHEIVLADGFYMRNRDA